MRIIKYSKHYRSKMVTKTERCSYTEYKIVPGRGSRFIAKDGRMHYFISTKARSLFHKKIKVDTTIKKRSRKTTRIQRAVVGMSIEEIRRKKAESREDRDKTIAANEKEIKERKAKAMQAKKADKSKQNKMAGGKKAEKAVKAVPKGGKK